VGYNYGVGEFPSYDERFTAPGGEIEIDAVLPLLQDLGMPAARAQVLAARAAVVLSEAERDRKRIEVRRKALLAYYKWLAAGAKRDVEQALYDQTASRNAALERELAQGTRARLEVLDNERAVLVRRNALVVAERDLGIAAQTLSLWYRDATGAPIVPTPDQLAPLDAPPAELPPVDADLDRIESRPDVRTVDALTMAVDIDRRRALALRRPGLDLVGEWIEPLAPEPDDEVEWYAGTVLKVPLLFRKERGAVDAAVANLDQLSQVRRGRVDAARAEIESARIAIGTARERVDLTDQAQDLASEVVDLERRRFAIGGGDVFELLGRETNLAKARKDAVDARFDLHVARIARQAATAELGE